jgi:hypothetical protein
MYLQVLSETLKVYVSENRFPGSERFIADPSAKVDWQDGLGGAVCIVGRVEFESVKDGADVARAFIYRLSDFDEEGRIGHWIFSVSPSSWIPKSRL